MKISSPIKYAPAVIVLVSISLSAMAAEKSKAATQKRTLVHKVSGASRDAFKPSKLSASHSRPSSSAPPNESSPVVVDVVAGKDSGAIAGADVSDAEASAAVMPSVVSISADDDIPDQITTEFGHAVALKFSSPTKRVAVADPRIADVTVLSPTEALLVGRGVGTTNLVFWKASGETKTARATVTLDLEPLRDSLALALPGQKGVRVNEVSGSVLLTGSVSDTLAADSVLSLAEAYVRNINRHLGGGSPPGSADGQATSGADLAGGSNAQARAVSRVINALTVLAPQQVMLEVKIAEVSKTLLEQLGLTVQQSSGNLGTGVMRWGIMSDVLGGNAAVAGLLFKKGKTLIDLDAQKSDSLVKILAEPNIVAMSGQQGSFLAGGRLLIPVSQPSTTGNTIQLAEREVGIGLKFLPTVLDNGRINLMVAPEVSEIAKEGVSLSSSTASTSLLPFITTRRVSTTVQLRDGQSLVIGGLLKNNTSQSVRAFPILGELPIIGPLFRSSQFAADKTELIVAVSATIVKPVDEAPELPTEKFMTPSRADFLMNGKMEGDTRGAK